MDDDLLAGMLLALRARARSDEEYERAVAVIVKELGGEAPSPGDKSLGAAAALPALPAGRHGDRHGGGRQGAVRPEAPRRGKLVFDRAILKRRQPRPPAKDERAD